MEYLCFWVTRDSVKPTNRKIEAITNMKPPTLQKEVQKFIDVINYYRNVWPRRAHTLAHLTILTSIKRKFKWMKVKKDSFGKIKRTVARNTLLNYPGFSETFKIHINASAFQFGAIISQKGKLITFYSRKLTDAQQRFRVTKRGLISIVETLKEFRKIILGQRLRIYTDHKNLTCKHFNTNIVLRWRLILEDYGPYIEYIKG